MDDSENLLRLIAILKENRQSGFLGFDIAGEPRFARMDEALSILGGARIGKSTGFIIPSVSCHPGPVIVVSTRDDVRNSTVNSREKVAREYGGNVTEVQISRKIKSPIIPIRSWDPTQSIHSWEDASRIADVIARVAIPGFGEERHWQVRTHDRLAPLLYAGNAFGFDFQQIVLDMYLNYLETFETFLADVYNAMAYVERGEIAPNLPNGLQLSRFPYASYMSTDAEGSIAGEERASLTSTVNSAIREYGLQQNEGFEQVDIDSFIESHGTLYLTTGQSNLMSIAPYISAFINEVVERWRDRYQEDGKFTRSPLLLALDETANIAPLPDLPNLLSTSGGNGIQIMTVFQNPALASSRWGEDGADVVLNSGHQLLLPGIQANKYLSDVTANNGYEDKEQLTIVFSRGRRYSHDRFSADPARLVSERRILEDALKGSEPTTRESIRISIHRHLEEARRRDGGIRVRPEYSGEEFPIFAELAEFTNVESVRERRLRVEVSDITQLKRGQAFLREDGILTSFTYEPYFNSPYWRDLITDNDTNIYESVDPSCNPNIPVLSIPLIDDDGNYIHIGREIGIDPPANLDN